MREEWYKITGSWHGELTIVPRPRGGDWWEDDVRSWARSGMEVIGLPLKADEAEVLGLAREGEFCRAYGIKFVSFPIQDRGVSESGEEVDV